jgi:adenosylcobinamide-phosphate synthase
MDLWLDAVLIVLLALAIDAVIGEVPNAIHPLRWMGNILGWLDRHISRGGRASTRIKGMLSYLIVLILFGAVEVAILAAVRVYVGEIAWIVVSALFLKVTFAVFSFRRHCRPIMEDLEDGDAESAAAKVQMIVSRNTKGMDSEHIASSCCETISENLVDSVMSPTFYGGLLGLPGALMFRCANLMDAMWGYINEKYGDLGFFPAKFDDVLGYLTSRVSPVFVAAAAIIMRMDWRAAVPCARAEHTKTPSPNSGWPMTAVSGVMGISMEKKGVYVMGSGPMPTPADIARCYRLVELTSVLFILCVMLPLYVFAGVHVQLFFESLFAAFMV